MSQATEEKPRQLLIDLTNARQATALNADSILHRMQLEAFLNRVDDVVGRVDGFSAKLRQCGDGHGHSVSYERYHDVITLHGKRGSGKTTFLLSALELLQGVKENQRRFRDRGRENLKNLCVLEILDPTLFGLHEHLLLSLLAKITFEVKLAVKNNGRSLQCEGADDCELEKWKRSLSHFAKSLKHMGETRDDLDGDISKETVQWEDAEFIFEQNMDSARRSFGLERDFHKFLNESLRLIGKKAFVLALDDIDTRPQIGWHVLEVLRRYFTSPQLVVILSGDMDLFKTIIEKQQLKIFDLNFASEAAVRKEFKSRVDGLTEQYLLKILRTPARINLGSFQSALQQWNRLASINELKIGKGEQYVSIFGMLRNSFFPLLACQRTAEQRLFQQTLFANPARTVTQVLDSLWGVTNRQVQARRMGGIIAREWAPIVARFREVFLVSLQNLGFERPFDLAEALQSSHGLNLLMKQLFERGYLASGLELLPTRQSLDENNALLTLHAELTFAMRETPGVLMAYALKTCFLREVLQRQRGGLDPQKYKKYESYLCLDSEEQPSTTASRIAALHWGHPQSNSPIRAVGLVRLYGGSMSKNTRPAVRAMYGREFADLVHRVQSDMPSELQNFFQIVQSTPLKKGNALRRWINSPESLFDTITSWQRSLLGLGIVEVRVADGNFRAFSIFPLLAAMCDILESDEENVANVMSQYSQIITVNEFESTSTFAEQEKDCIDDILDDDFELFGPSTRINKEFIRSLNLWKRNCYVWLPLVSSPVPLCARIMNRFFRALVRIDLSMANHSTYAGLYVHRCLVAFLNSVLVEEFLHKNVESDEKYVLLDNPTTEDDVFLKNMFSSRAIVDRRRGSQEVHWRGRVHFDKNLFTATFKNFT